MAPKDNREAEESVEKRLFKLEYLQGEQERHFNELRSEMCETRDIAEEARAMSLQTQAAVEGVPGKVMDALRKEKRENRFEFRDWMQMLVAIVMVIAAVYTAMN